MIQKEIKRKIQTFGDTNKIRKEIIQLQWESFFMAIKIMCHYCNGLMPKDEYEDFRMGKITYPRLQPMEVR